MGNKTDTAKPKKNTAAIDAVLQRYLKLEGDHSTYMESLIDEPQETIVGLANCLGLNPEGYTSSKSALYRDIISELKTKKSQNLNPVVNVETNKEKTLKLLDELARDPARRLREMYYVVRIEAREQKGSGVSQSYSSDGGTPYFNRYQRSSGVIINLRSLNSAYGDQAIHVPFGESVFVNLATLKELERKHEVHTKIEENKEIHDDSLGYASSRINESNDTKTIYGKSLNIEILNPGVFYTPFKGGWIEYKYSMDLEDFTTPKAVDLFSNAYSSAFMLEGR